eukprot:TRINITY_DN24148_c0_g1_i2.p1 TRINITY_DN24148_c0_g1~~TRINITY_DN24148_c0_g1_i2.p1  ORF type:complete len:376 (-),score=41.02 TRINITY_DN24148_c0_g1_i2:8-1135(-)
MDRCRAVGFLFFASCCCAVCFFVLSQGPLGPATPAALTHESLHEEVRSLQDRLQVVEAQDKVFRTELQEARDRLQVVETQDQVLRTELQELRSAQLLRHQQASLPSKPVSSTSTDRRSKTSKLEQAGGRPAPIRIPHLHKQSARESGGFSSPGKSDRCVGRGSAEKDVGEACLSQIFQEAGCSGALPPEGYSGWFRSRTYDELVRNAMAVSQMFKYDQLKTCRGLQRDTSWPKLYSQLGQDFYVLSRFQEKPGFYVDVGAHHGSFNSNTKTLQDVGWKGICVEPLPLNRFADRTCTLVTAAVVPFPHAEPFINFQNCEEPGAGIPGHSRLSFLVDQDTHPCRSQRVKAVTWLGIFGEQAVSCWLPVKMLHRDGNP